MATIVGGNYDPLEVRDTDLVGYLGAGDGFIMLNPIKKYGRKFPPVLDPDSMQTLPLCFSCVIHNNQKINFHGTFATLHDVNGEWYVRHQETSDFVPLQPHTFFEIGHLR